jgi:hypothetical protein
MITSDLRTDQKESRRDPEKWKGRTRIRPVKG